MGLFARLFRTPLLPGVLSASEFEKLFDRECALVYRHPHSFSLVVFLPDGADEQGLRKLATILFGRLRSGDVVGRLDNKRLAAVLPYTDGESAWKLADDLVRRMAEVGLKFDCTVYTFPPADEEQATDEGRRASGPHLPQDDDFDDQDGPSPTGDEGDEDDQEGDEHDNQRVAMVAESETSLGTIRADGERPVLDMTPLMVRRLPLSKRAIDIVVSGLALILLSPLLLILAIAVRLSSRGPIIFCQQRAGAGGRPFSFYKFRSMYIDAEERKKELAHLNEKDGPVFKMKHDPRVTPVGRFIRKYSLDELPQLWNVFRGDMTLVGPRPATMDEVPEYEPWQRQRLNLVGGITCTWQVSGRSEISFEDWMRMDARYVEQQGFLSDIGLLAKTAKAVVTGRGAY